MTAREREILKDAEIIPPSTPTEQRNGTSWADWPEDTDPHVTATGRPTPKWRGTSILDIRTRQNEAHEARMGIQALRRAEKAAQDALHAEVQSILGIKIWLANWPCQPSPALQCIYLASDDEGVECIFCGEPVERG